MAYLTMITYTREGETFTSELKEIADALHSIYQNEFEVIICCEAIFDIHVSLPYEIKMVNCSGTKYRRLIYAMSLDDSTYYISVDNDILGNIHNIIKLVREMIRGDYDVGWGKIETRNVHGIISKLVSVDKMLSHNILRPFMWNCKIGISVPGQVFCIKAASYRGNLIKLDTFLDDLALGLYSSNTQKKIFMLLDVMGYESPNTTIKGLWQQRIRWAKGFVSILHGVHDTKSKCKVIAHGFAYHGLWIVVWAVLGFIINQNGFCGILGLLLLALLISGRKISMIKYAVLYIILFPLFHLRWIYELISNLSEE